MVLPPAPADLPAAEEPPQSSAPEEDPADHQQAAEEVAEEADQPADEDPTEIEAAAAEPVEDTVSPVVEACENDTGMIKKTNNLQYFIYIRVTVQLFCMTPILKFNF